MKDKLQVFTLHNHLRGGAKTNIVLSLFLVNTALLEGVEMIVNVFSLLKSSSL